MTSKPEEGAARRFGGPKLAPHDAAAMTMVVSETTLSAGVSSICAELTDAWFVQAPTVWPVALNVIVTVWPGRIDAKLQMTCDPIAEHIPDADVA
jgi:hypothetical protein